MKKIIITGATGCIGLALIQELMKHDVDITVISRRSSPRSCYIPQNPRITIINSELDSLLELKNVLLESYDIFYHMAWNGSNVSERNNPDIQFKNIKFTLDAVELAYTLNCHTFIGTGSQAEYGMQGGKLTAQTPTNPTLAYGMTKLCAGNLSRLKCKQYGLKHIWTRILSVYGPSSGIDSVLMYSIKSLSQGISPSYTYAEQKWDYMFSEDAAKALYLLSMYGIDGKVYCIGSGNVKKLAEYLEILKDCINPNLNLRLGELPYRENQVMYLAADISELEKDTGFKVKYSFEEGISKTIQWYQEVNNE